MNIISARFVKGVKGTDDILFDGKVQIAFIGRSNVGKSSLINSLVNKNNLARSSSNPGKTVRIDFFLINDQFYFVDLPGYGYAKKSSPDREQIQKMLYWYLVRAEIKNRLVILIIDSNVGITDFDRETLSYLNKYAIPFLIVANKVDKLKMGQKEKQLAIIQKEIGNATLIPHSAKTKEGRLELLKEISNIN